MDGYLMFGKKIECHLMDAPHKDIFKHGNREWTFVPNQTIFRNKKNQEAENKTDEQKAARVKGLLEKEKEKRIRMKELGIEYAFPGYQAIIDAQLADKPAASSKKERKNSEESKEVKSKSSKKKSK